MKESKWKKVDLCPFPLNALTAWLLSPAPHLATVWTPDSCSLASTVSRLPREAGG